MTNIRRLITFACLLLFLDSGCYLHFSYSRNTLCNPRFVAFCNDNFIFWGATVSKSLRTSASKKSALFTFSTPRIYPHNSIGPSVAGRFRATGFPYLAIVEPSKDKQVLLRSFNGYYDVDQLIFFITQTIRLRFLQNMQQQEQVYALSFFFILFHLIIPYSYFSFNFT